MGFESKYFSERRRPLAVQILQRFEQLAVVCAKRWFALWCRFKSHVPKYLFADRLNPQLPRFFSWRSDPNATASDALQQDSSHENFYTYISSVLLDNAITSEGTRGRIDTSHSLVAKASLVPWLVGPVSIPTSSFSYDSISVTRSSGWDIPFDCEPDSNN
jgi:hypothetical protein